MVRIFVLVCGEKIARMIDLPFIFIRHFWMKDYKLNTDWSY